MNVPSDPHPQIESLLPEVRELRRNLHRHPELGYEEHQTAARVLKFIEDIDGLQIQTGVADTGIVVTLGADLKGPCVALRADMDALPIEEESGVEWASTIPGKMHACGHDGHTAMLAGAVRVLARSRDQLTGPVKFIFQPAEEGGAGARRMCEEGVLDNPSVTAIYGLHNNLPSPDLPLGSIVYAPGAIMAGTGTFDIEVIGKGGHAAFPHRCVDPLYTAAAIVEQLQGIVSREVDPLAPAVVSVTSFHAGSSHNIIAGRAFLKGTFRSLDDGVREQIRRAIIRCAEQVAAARGATVEIRCELGYPTLVNDPRAEGVFLRVLEESGFGANLEIVDPMMSGEDFAYFSQRVPSFFYCLGACPEGRRDNPVCHSPAFDFNDDLLPLGIRLHVETALRFARLWKA